MDAAEPTVLQTGPESFEVWVDGNRNSARLAHRTRRGLGLQGVPPVAVVTEMVRFLHERSAWPPNGDTGEVDLGPAAGRFPEFSEELRSRLV
jgi:hypothetical protein